MLLVPRNIQKFRSPVILLAFAISFSVEMNIHAQDIHLSQFYTTPILTNPANTGMSGEDLRIANNYRNQWARIGTPYKTLYTSIDKKLTISDQSFGMGGMIIHDQSSAYNLTADELLLSLSYSKIIHNQQFTIGIQPGFVFKSYNNNGLTFGLQFDQLSQQFNTNLASMEDGLTGNLQYFDLNVGIFWHTLIRTIMPSVGISLSHINTPMETFSTASTGTRRPMKLTFNSQVTIPIDSRFDITPSFLYGYTTGAHEMLLGGIEGYAIRNFIIPIKKVYAITMFRVNPLNDIDAMIWGGGVKFTKFDVGISYDFNISPLATAASFNGAFEISLIFTGNHVQKAVNEPCYIH
jgi:type IX secretion system PorP/SprF family membrane protein